VLTEGSWEERMVAQCRSRLAIKPNSARAVLFYSQLPNGEEDRSSLHGGCPVLEGTKVRYSTSHGCFSQPFSVVRCKLMGLEYSKAWLCRKPTKPESDKPAQRSRGSGFVYQHRKEPVLCHGRTLLRRSVLGQVWSTGSCHQSEHWSRALVASCG